MPKDFRGPELEAPYKFLDTLGVWPPFCVCASSSLFLGFGSVGSVWFGLPSYISCYKSVRPGNS